MHGFKQLWILIFSIGLVGCLEELEFGEEKNIYNQIVIQGKLTKGTPSIIEVSVSEVFDFFKQVQFLRVKEVTIIDQKDNRLELTSRKQGFYELEIPEDHPFFKINYGIGYKIEVTRTDGRVYESDFDFIFPAPKPKELTVKTTKEQIVSRLGDITTQEQLSFFINTPLNIPDSLKNSRILWELEGVSKLTDAPPPSSPFQCISIEIGLEPKSCYVLTSPVRNYVTLNSASLTIDSINGINLYNTGFSTIFAEGYYFVVLQQALSESAYNYWSKVGLVVNRTSNVFQEPVGNISSNIRNLNDLKEEVFGFFYATEPEILRVYVSPEMAKNPKRACPESPIPSYCCNCEELEDSSTEKPEWWVE